MTMRSLDSIILGATFVYAVCPLPKHQNMTIFFTFLHLKPQLYIPHIFNKLYGTLHKHFIKFT
jgi:hypothetical protein